MRRLLRTSLPSLDVTTEPRVLDGYSSDTYWKALARQANGDPLGRPEVVVFPSTEGAVARILRVASDNGIPVVPRGGGSGSQGGAVPSDGGILVDLCRLDDVLDIDECSMTVTVQAGKVGKALEAELNERGLMFPHYPGSAEWATVGGYIAARGSGVLSTRYGKIEDLVVSMRVALPNGELVDTLGVPRHAVGPDIAPLIIGSEGTLGIITSATLQLRLLPPARQFEATLFDSVPQGVAAMREVMVRGLRPAVIRLYDEIATPHTLRPVLGDDTPDGVCALLMFEGEPAVARAEAAATLRICREHGATALPRSLASQWWDRRYDFYGPPHEPQLPSVWGTFDIVARYSNILPAYTALQDAVGRPYGARYGLQLRTHFSHWYPWGTMYYGRFGMPDPGGDALAIHDQIWHDGIEAVIAAGGAMNDHHGVGSKLAPWMRLQCPSGFAVLEQIKAALDPAGVMNPGKLGFATRYSEPVPRPVATSRG